MRSHHKLLYQWVRRRKIRHFGEKTFTKEIVPYEIAHNSTISLDNLIDEMIKDELIEVVKYISIKKISGDKTVALYKAI